MSERIAGCGIQQLLERWCDDTFYVAHQTSMHRRVLLRVLATERGSERGDKFLEDARRLAAIDHPNVARLHEAGHEAGRVYCSMEYPGDDTLEKLLFERGRLAAAEALEIAGGVLAALGCVHAQGLIHGGLRPRVVFVVGSRVKVAGFGASRPREMLLLGDAVQFISPEHVSGGALDARTDLYSLGMILYRALSGRLPYRDLDPRAVMRRQVEEKPPALADLVGDLPAAVTVAVSRAIEKDPRLRYRSAEDMAAALAGTESPATGPASGPTESAAPAGKPPKRPRRRRHKW